MHIELVWFPYDNRNAQNVNNHFQCVWTMCVALWFWQRPRIKAVFLFLFSLEIGKQIVKMWFSSLFESRMRLTSPDIFYHGKFCLLWAFIENKGWARLDLILSCEWCEQMIWKKEEKYHRAMRWIKDVTTKPHRLETNFFASNENKNINNYTIIR